MLYSLGPVLRMESYWLSVYDVFPSRLACWSLLLAVCLAWSSCAETDNPVLNPSKQLHDHLMVDYGSVLIRPVINISHPTAVYHRILVSQVIDFNEPLQRLTVSAWQRMEWTDEFLRWDPRNHSGVDVIQFKPDAVWKPDLQLFENVDKDFLRVAETMVHVNYDGNVTWYTPVISTSSCRVEVRYFPFDTQICNLSFSSWVYDGAQLDLHLHNGEDDDAQQNAYMGNGVWDVSEVRRIRGFKKYDCCPSEYITVVYAIVLRREYAFYLVNMIIPSITLCLTNTLVYIIPPESGEKVQFAVSNLLASILFQQLITAAMPPLGDELPLLGAFFLFMVVCSCFSIACSILSLRLYNKNGDKPVPSYMRKLILLTHPSAHRRLLYRVNTMRSMRGTRGARSNDSQHSQEQTGDEECDDNGSQKGPGFNSLDNNHVDVEKDEKTSHERTTPPCRMKRKQSASFKRDVIIEEWRLLARVIDKTIFTMVLIITFVVLLSLILTFVNKSNHQS